MSYIQCSLNVSAMWYQYVSSNDTLCHIYTPLIWLNLSALKIYTITVNWQYRTCWPEDTQSLTLADRIARCINLVASWKRSRWLHLNSYTTEVI